MKKFRLRCILLNMFLNNLLSCAHFLFQFKKPEMESKKEETDQQTENLKLFLKTGNRPKKRSPGRKHHHRSATGDPVLPETPTRTISETPTFSTETQKFSSETPNKIVKILKCKMLLIIYNVKKFILS